MNEQPVLLLDMDGVTYDFFGGILNKLADKNISVQPEDQNSFYIWDSFPEHENILKAIITEPGFYRGLKVAPGAVDFVEAISDMGVKVVFCSSPSPVNPTCEDDKRFCLARDFGEGYAKEAIIQRDKTVATGNVLIDDRPKITGEESHPVWSQLLFDAPYNLDSDIPRISNWLPAEAVAQLVYDYIMSVQPAK